MREAMGRILRDVRNRRQLEAYAVAIVAMVLAVLSIVEAAVPENLKWAALLVGVGLLVYQITLPPAGRGRASQVLADAAQQRRPGCLGHPDGVGDGTGDQLAVRDRSQRDERGAGDLR
jgi:hypothetical protein